VVAAIIAVVVYGMLATYLIPTKHVTLASDKPAIKFIGWLKIAFCVCIDKRDHGKYRIAGGAGVFALGLSIWLFRYFFAPTWWWLDDLARAQFLMALPDIAIFWFQLAKNFGPEIVVVESHGLRKPGCGRTSAHDPVGAIMYLAQIILEYKSGQEVTLLRYLRGFWQFFVYDLLGAIMVTIVCLPTILVGKITIGWPF